MESVSDFLDLSCQAWVFLWDKKQDKILSTGEEALQAWNWYQLEGGAEQYQLFFPFRHGILQSAWALDQILAYYFAKEGVKLDKNSWQVMEVLVASANVEAEREKIRQLVGQHGLRRVKVRARANFFVDYLNQLKNFSELKLIIDCHQEFVEMSLFLGNDCLKTKHLLLSGKMDKNLLTAILNQALDVFLLNLPRHLLANQWQYFYLFLAPKLAVKPDIDQLNQQLRMEAVVMQKTFSELKSELLVAAKKESR